MSGCKDCEGALYGCPYEDEDISDCDDKAVMQRMLKLAYKCGRTDAIDECIKLIGGNTKTIVGVVFDKSIPIDDRAYARCIKNKFIEELVEQLEKLKEQK